MSNKSILPLNFVSSLRTLFIDNPVFMRDIRSRMRGTRIVIIISLYIIIICTVTFLYSLHSLNQLYLSAQNTNQLSNIGNTLYKIILTIMSYFIVFFTPMALSGVVASEKEKQTFDFIRVTTLSPWRYTIGYILANTLFTTLLIFCTLPVISLSFIFGGVSPDEVIYSYIVLICLALLLSALGLMISTLRKNVRAAQTTTIGVLFLSYFMVPLALNFFSRMYGWQFFAPSSLTDLLLGKTSFLGILVPNVILILFFIGYLFSFFYIIASRKLYSIEVKSFSYSQFTILLLIADIILLSLFWKQTSIQTFSFLFIITFIMIMIAVFNFCPNVIEIGDESWRIKNRIKLFRRIDEATIFVYCIFIFQFIILIIFFYTNPPYIAPGKATLFNISNVNVLTLGHILQSLLILFFITTFMVAIAKLGSQIMKTRVTAVRFTLASFIIIFVLLPFITLVFYLSLPANKAFPAAILKMTPHIALTKILGHPLYQRMNIKEAFYGIDPVTINLCVYSLISLIVIVLTRIKRKKSQANFLKLFSDNPFEKTDSESSTNESHLP